jgi:hypothetical protein
MGVVDVPSAVGKGMLAGAVGTAVMALTPSKRIRGRVHALTVDAVHRLVYATAVGLVYGWLDR